MSALPARRTVAPSRRFSAAIAEVDQEPAVPPEWGEAAALMDNLWKDEFDGWRGAAYVHVFAEAGFTPDEVSAAVTQLGGKPGGNWLPSSQVIAAEVCALRRVGTYDWAEEIVGAAIAAHCTTTGAFYREAVDDDLALALLAVDETQGPILVTYLTLLGGPYGRARAFDDRRRRLAWARAVAEHTLQNAGALAPATHRP